MATAKAYFTLVPTYGPKGTVQSISIGSRTTKKPPKDMGDGAVLFELEVEMPDGVFAPVKVHVFVDEEHLRAKKPVKVFVVKDED